MSLAREYIEFKHEPCPVCGHRDRCKNSIEYPGDLILCFRLGDPEVNGFRLQKHTRGCSTYVRIGSSADRKANVHQFSARKPIIGKVDLDDLISRYTRGLTDSRLSQFVNELGVSADALRALGAGLNGVHLCFPERDASKRVIGISTRYPNEKPKYRAGKGHSRGLLIPSTLPSRLSCLVLPEGPSDTAACIDMRLDAIGRPNNNSKADLIAAVTKGVGVLIVAGENDQKPDGSWPGREGAIKVATELARTLKRPVLWALPPAGFKDIRDYRIANKDRDPVEVGRELLAHFLLTATTIGPFDGFGGATSSESTEIWPEPQSLPTELPPVAAFQMDLLPEALRPWIEDISERAQCPPDFPAVGAMVSLAAVVGRKVAIRPKCRDDWTVVPNLWGGVIGRPGLLKTPMLQEATRPLKRLEVAARDRFQEECRSSEAKKIVRDAEWKELKKSIEKAVKDGQDAEELARSGLAQRAEAPEAVRQRYILNDTTVEKLGEILNENPNGVLLFRDELIGLLRSLEKDGHECDRAFYLEAWDGKGRFTYDRIGRGTIDIESAIVSILGGIQPNVLHTFLRSSLDRVGNDGLIQRFQLLVWPDVPTSWRNVDEWPDTAAKARAYAAFVYLDELNPLSIQAEQGDGDDEIPFLRFDDSAQPLFEEWRSDLEIRLRSGELHPILEEHLAKYRSLIPSLALLIHLIDRGCGPVGIEPLEKAIRWGGYLESHARRVYHVASNPDVAAASALARKIQKGELPDGFTLHEVHRHEWAGLSDRDVLQGGADLLCELDWLRPTRKTTGGAPKIRYWINPKIHRTPPKATDKTDKSSADGLSSVLTGDSGELGEDFDACDPTRDENLDEVEPEDESKES